MARNETPWYWKHPRPAQELFARWNAWMHERGSAKMVYRKGREYLERRYLLALGIGRLRWSLLRKWKFKAFLHTFWQSDPDPPHDHPWDWGRIIIRGRYREWYHDGTFVDCGPGHIVWRRDARVLHRVELQRDGFGGELPVTTIFWHWGRWRLWGFMHPTGWRPTPPHAQDGRPLVGTFFPRKVGPDPTEAPCK